MRIEFAVILSLVLLLSFSISEFRGKYGHLKNYSPEIIKPRSPTECQADSDCVPAQCCHPTSCVPRSSAPDCSGVFCTMECRPGTMDCGQGECKCIQGRCEAVIY